MAKNLPVTRYEVTDLRWLIEDELKRINSMIDVWKGFTPHVTPDDYNYLINRRRRLKKIEKRLIELA